MPCSGFPSLASGRPSLRARPKPALLPLEVAPEFGRLSRLKSRVEGFETELSASSSSMATEAGAPSRALTGGAALAFASCSISRSSISYASWARHGLEGGESSHGCGLGKRTSVCGHPSSVGPTGTDRDVLALAGRDVTPSMAPPTLVDVLLAERGEEGRAGRAVESSVCMGGAEASAGYDAGARRFDAPPMGLGVWLFTTTLTEGCCGARKLGAPECCRTSKAAMSAAAARRRGRSTARAERGRRFVQSSTRL